MESFEIEQLTEKQQIELTHYLSQFMLPSRLETLERVLQQRTRYFTVVLEDIFQSHNANAVLRTCECFGVQDVNIIENRNKYLYNPDVVRGANKWLTLKRHHELEHNTRAAFTLLREQGYRIVVTSPHHRDVDLPSFDVAKGKFAVVIGNEREGISKIAMEMADEFLKVPMVGFTESLNLSVCTAIMVQEFKRRMEYEKIPAALSLSEMTQLRLEWILKSLKRADLLVDKYFELK